MNCVISASAGRSFPALYSSIFECLSSMDLSLSDVESLSFSGNDEKLETMPPTVAAHCQCLTLKVSRFSCLRCLDMSGNNLSGIDEGLMRVLSLTSLDLGYNKNISSLPPSISKLRNLTCVLFEYALSLRNLTVCGNQVSSLPPELGCVPLEYCNVSFNPLSRLPDCLLGMHTRLL